MKKIILIGMLFLASCEKEEAKQDSTSICECYEIHEAQQGVLNGNGTVGTAWKYWKTTPKQPDLCAKETGQYIYSANGGTRFKIYCD